MKKYLVTLVLAVTLLIGIPALASDISTAVWSGTVIVSNNSSAANNVVTVMTLNTTQMVTQGYMNSSGNNTAMRSGAGADVPYMPGYTPGGYPWAIFVPSLDANFSSYDILYTGGTANMDGDIRYFPGSGGMTIDDAASLEFPTDNYSIEVKGRWNTANNSVSVDKPFSVIISAGDGDNVTAQIASAETSIIQDAYDAVISVYSGIPYSGEKFSNFPISFIDKVSFHLYKQGAPTGTGYAKVFRVSDGVEIGSLGMINVASIAASPGAWYDFDARSVNNTSVQDLRIAFEYSGGSGANYIAAAQQTTDVYADGELTYDDPWIDDNTHDAAFKVYMSGLTLTGSGITSGSDHIVTLTCDGSNTTLELDGTTIDSDTVFPIDDKATDWVIGDMIYMEYFKVWKGGNLVCDISWEYGTTFTDASGNGNDATPTFITASSDADISATLSTFKPIVEADAPAYTIDDPPNFITTTPGASGNFTAGTMNVTAPGWPVIRQVAIAGAVPERLVATLLTTLALLMVSFALSWMFKSNNNNNILIKSSVVFALMCIFVAVHLMDVWQVYFFTILAIGIMWLSRQREAY